ncbi:MAG: hypothetical protein WCC10_02985 [Tumebacillaceae bacterium]
MIISLYLFLTWFAVGALFTWPNRLPRQPLVFAFLFCVFLNTNIGYLLADPFGFIKVAEDMSRNVCFSLYQSFIMPAVLALACNAYFVSSFRKTAVVLISTCVFFSLDVLARALQLFTVTGFWHLPALVGYQLLLLYVCIFAVKGFQRMCKS